MRKIGTGRSPSHVFAEIPNVSIPRSSFDRSHALKTTFDSGYLIPTLVDEVLPGDSFKLDVSDFARLSTPIVPFMDNLYLDRFFFFVPYRLLWTNFQVFMGEQDDPLSPTSYLVPQVVASGAGGFAVGSLFDYFGLPTAVNSLSVSAFASRAYNLIWNEWFRDENLQTTKAVVDKDDGPDTVTDYVLKKRGKRHDYFTSCLPWAQKADPVQMSLGSTAPIMLDMTLTASNKVLRASDRNGPSVAGAGWQIDASNNIENSVSTDVVIDPNGQWYADLSTATAATINSLRESVALQHFYELDARGGTRYTEIVRAHFGVVSPDARLQRPEYLGGSSTRINVYPIPQNSATGATGTPQGNLAAMGVSAHSGTGFVKSFTEHGIILGLVSVRADLTYQQGLHRSWTRQTREDFFWPSFAHLGEQAVLSKEIYCDGSVDDEDVFGYQERYAEYRYKPSQITGKFRSTYATSLDVWHLAQEFGARPTLNATFIEENPPVDRVVAVNTEPQFLYDAYFSMRCARPMPLYSVPGLNRL
ncbi:major capsid protein [Microviridae sp.]|nr:major capsid protein [Microviridae sp.]